jgi:hypothetical protein
MAASATVNAHADRRGGLCRLTAITVVIGPSNISSVYAAGSDLRPYSVQHIKRSRQGSYTVSHASSLYTPSRLAQEIKAEQMQDHTTRCKVQECSEGSAQTLQLGPTASHA